MDMPIGRMNENEMDIDEEMKCPCCGKTLVREYDICEVCFWQNDLVQLGKPNLSGGANKMSLQEARAAYKAGKPVK